VLKCLILRSILGCSHLLNQCSSTFSGFVHPCHRLLHSHSPHYSYSYCECIADVTIINYRISILDKDIAVLHPRYTFRLAASWLRSLSTADHRLTFEKLFFRFISTCAISKEETRGYLLPESFVTDESMEFYCLHNYLCCCLKNCGDLFRWMPCWFVEDSAALKEPKIHCYIKMAKHALSRRLMARFFTCRKKKFHSKYNHHATFAFQFLKESILDTEISFQTWFFKLRS